jgi:predicted RNA polymerase sigma factor
MSGRAFAPELIYQFKLREDLQGETPTFENEIQGDLLRMMFSCCQPELSTEAQVTLILKTLCGFSVSEIAHALLTSEDSIEKRLGRARRLFRLSGSVPESATLQKYPNAWRRSTKPFTFYSTRVTTVAIQSGQYARTSVLRRSAWRFF